MAKRRRIVCLAMRTQLLIWAASKDLVVAKQLKQLVVRFTRFFQLLYNNHIVRLLLAHVV